MEWNRRNLLTLTILLTLGFGFGGYLAVRDQGGLHFTLFRLRQWSLKQFGGARLPTTEEKRLAKREAEDTTARILKKYRELRVIPKKVAPEDNGFLAIYKIEGDLRLQALGQSEILRNLQSEKIDAPGIRSELAEYREIGMVIEKIAATSERSSAGMPDDYIGYFAASSAKYMADYLLLMARLAAIEKNEEEALRFVKLAVNLGNHLREIEQPSLLTETIVILFELSERNVVIEFVLKDLGREADLEKWRELLSIPDNSPMRHWSVIRGEWNYFAQNYAYLFFLKQPTSDAIPDPAALLEAYAAWTAAHLPRYSQQTLAEFANHKSQPFDTFAENLSAEAKGLQSLLGAGSSAWLIGRTRACLKFSQFDAAMDLLIREKAGEDLSKLTETYQDNPFTETPFSFDPKTRTIFGGHNSNGDKIDDLILPW